MNTPNAHLWELIMSMSPAEKRYYKTHFASDDSLHTDLFNLLNEQTSFNNDKIKQTLKVTASLFKVLKAQLYELLIKSLIAQQGKKSLRSSIRLGLEEVDLLLEREHYKRATKKLTSLAKISKQYGLTLYQYEITERLHEIQYLEPGITDRESKKHYEQLSLFQNRLTQKQHLSSIHVELSAWTPFMPERHNVINKLLKQLYSMKAEHLDFGTFILWYQSVATCHELLGAEKEAISIRHNILSFFENKQNLQRGLPLNYLRALIQAVSPNSAQPNIDRVNDLALKAKKHIATFPQYSPHYIYFLLAQLQAYYLRHQWKPILGQLDQQCISYIATYQLENIKTTTLIQVILATAQLINENYERTATLLQSIKRQNIHEKPLDYNISLLELCLLWERKEYNQLYKKTLQLKAILKHRKEQNYSKLYNLHINLFSDLSRKPFSVEEKASMSLLKIAEYPYDPILHYYSLFNLERWLQAVATKRKWKDVLKKNAPNRRLGASSSL